MEQAVQQFFNQEILNQAAALFNVNINDAKLLGDFENYVYEVKRKNKPYVLRLTYSSHRGREQVEAELDWLQFLSRQGIGAAAPLLSIHGRLTECLPVKQGYFTVSLFEKAPGCSVRVDDDTYFHDALFTRWGETIGKMHGVTRAYVPSPGVRKRMDWQDEELAVALQIAKKEPFLLEKMEGLLQQIRTLPVNKDVYGLIHTDLHSGNFFADEQHLTVFDFDDCCYHWFVNDLAIPLFYASFYRHIKDEEARQGFARRFFTAFLSGYLREYSLDLWWIEKIPLFLRLRDITFYSVLRLKLSEEELTPRIK
ncbi:phosphotransferase enzyme family protein, partial [Bacillus songklensis]